MKYVNTTRSISSPIPIPNTTHHKTKSNQTHVFNVWCLKESPPRRVCPLSNCTFPRLSASNGSNYTNCSLNLKWCAAMCTWELQIRTVECTYVLLSLSFLKVCSPCSQVLLVAERTLWYVLLQKCFCALNMSRKKKSRSLNLQKL